MTTVRDIENALFAWAPKELAEEWDNVGLLVGDGAAPVHKVLVALDITEAVAEEAAALGAELIVSHHPVIFPLAGPLCRVTADDGRGRILTKLLRHGISAVCMHTNLDAAQGGVNDILAEKLGLQDVQPFNEEKIGRFGTLNCEIPLVEFVPLVVKWLDCSGARYISGGKSVHRVAVGGGACGDYIPQVLSMGCDTFITSDLKYNHFLDTQMLNLIDAGHFPTENVICPVIAGRLRREFPALTVINSTVHTKEVIQYCMKEN